MKTRAPNEANARVQEELTAFRDQLGRVAAIALMLIGGAVVTSFAFIQLQPPLLIGALWLFAALGGGLWLLLRGEGAKGRAVLLLALGLALMGRSVAFGGVSSGPFVGWVAVVLLASVLMNRRAAWLAAALGITWGLALLTLQGRGLLPDPIRVDTPLASLLNASALFLLIALLASTMNHATEQALLRFANADEERRRREERYRLAAQGSQFGVWELDVKSGRVWLGPGVTELMGRPRGEERTTREAWLSLIHPDDAGGARDALLSHMARETETYLARYRVRHPEHGWCWVRSRGKAVRGVRGEVLRVVGSLEDVRDQKALEDELERRADYDALTGLPNRHRFLTCLGQALADAQARRDPDFAVIFVDMDRFKVINDSLGHAAGDELLVRFGERLVECIRPTDIVARLGGDEFTLLLHGVRSLETAEWVVQRIERELSHPYQIAGREVSMRASLGILMGSLDYEDPLDLLRDADLAMYSVKNQPYRGIGVFEPQMRQRMRELLELDQALSHALEQGEIIPWYQPIVDLRTGRTVGYEALARWVRADGEVLTPARFIHRAEETGLISELDRQILAQAAETVGRWVSEGEDLYLSVNLSARQIYDQGLVERIYRTVSRSSLPMDRLQIEITEAALLSDAPRVQCVLESIRALGARIAFDDFGTGYSSLSYLHRFELEVLKIDLSFVHEGPDDQPGPICQSIQSVADALGIKTVAEGVETEAQRAALIAMGCRFGQGYLFGKAQSAETARQQRNVQRPLLRALPTRLRY